MKQKLDANLIKKYHQDIVFNYAEYPTKDHWSVNFNSIDYQKAITEWFPKNQNKKIFFYVHIPFELAVWAQGKFDNTFGFWIFWCVFLCSPKPPSMLAWKGV